MIIGKCARCGKEIKDNNIGDIITEEEVLVCESCAEKHRLYIINELNTFRNSKEFNEIIPLRKKILWTSEQLGNCFDSGDKSYVESVSDYDNYNVFELQVTILDLLQTVLDNYIFPKGILGKLYEEAIKRNPEMEKLRLEVREQQSKVASYISTEEFMYK